MAGIIRLFNADETVFSHYETVLNETISCIVSQEENGLYSLTMEHPLDDRITESKVISAPTPDGDQLFRIAKVRKVISGGKYVLEAYARHISYDLLNNFLLNIRPTGTTCHLALQSILSGTESPHSFTGSSDVVGVHTANYVRMNPIQAIMGQQDNSLLSLWGGYLKRDNFAIEIDSASLDRGFSVELGKNLVGIDETIDTADVVTRLYPTVVITDPTVTALPEKYVDSPLINNYPIIKEFRVDLTDEEKALPIEDVYTLMRDACTAQYTAGADKPKVNYTVDFVKLANTEQYKHLAILDTVNISDTVYVYVPLIGIDLTARIIKYEYDSLRERFWKLELGNFKPKLTNQTTEFRRIVEETIASSESEISARLREAMDTITGYRGGYVVTLVNDIGEPTAHLYMDTDDMATATNYIMINSQGIAFGDAGLATPPALAIGIDGSIVGNTAFFNSIKTNLISSDIGSSLNLASNTSIQLVSNSTITIDENGMTVDDGVSPTVGVHDGSGTYYKDRTTGNPFASYESGRADVDKLSVRKLYSPHVANKVSEAVSVYVDTTATGDGSGRDASNKASSLDRALQTALDGAMVIEEGVTIYVSGKVAEALRLKGYSGGGRIIVQGRGQITGQISVINCSCRVDFNDVDVVRPDASATAALISVVNSGDVRGDRCRLDGYGVGTGIGAYYGGNVYVTDTDIVNMQYGYDASVNGRIMQSGCRGSNVAYVANSALGSVISMTGTRPNGTTAAARETTEGLVRYASSTAANSTWSATPATWATVTKKFDAKLWTANAATGYVWKTGTWTQGAWDGTAQKGYADFGTAIKDWLDSTGGFRNIGAVTITAHRNTSSGGGSVSLKIASPSAQTLPGVIRGGTSSAALVSGLVTAMQAGALKLNSTTTATADYAGYDLITITVTAEKKV